MKNSRSRAIWIFWGLTGLTHTPLSAQVPALVGNSVYGRIKKASSESPDNLYGSRAWVFYSDFSTLLKKIIFSFLGFGLKSARIQETAGRIWTSISGDHLLNFNSNSRILNSKFRIFNSKFRIFNSKIRNLLQYAGKGVYGWSACRKGPQTDRKKSWRLKGQASSKSLLKYPFGLGPYRPRKNSHVHGHLGATQISSTWPPDLGAPRLIHAAHRSGGIWLPTYIWLMGILENL